MSFSEISSNNQPTTPRVTLAEPFYRTESLEPLMRVPCCPICSSSYGSNNQCFMDPYAPGQHYCKICLDKLRGERHPTDPTRIIIPEEWTHCPFVEDQTPEPLPPPPPPPPKEVLAIVMDVSGSTEKLLPSTGGEKKLVGVFDVIIYLVKARVSQFTGQNVCILPITISDGPQVGPLIHMGSPSAYTELVAWVKTLYPRGGTNFGATFMRLLQELHDKGIKSATLEVITDGAFDKTLLPLPDTVREIMTKFPKIKIREMIVIGVGDNADLAQATSIQCIPTKTLPLPSSDPDTALSTYAVYHTAEGNPSEEEKILLGELLHQLSSRNLDPLRQFIDTLPPSLLAKAIQEEFKLDGTLWKTIGTMGKPQKDNRVANMIESLITCLGENFMPTLGPINGVLYPTLAASMAPYAIYAAKNPLISYTYRPPINELAHSGAGAPGVLARSISLRAPSINYAADGAVIFGEDIL